jgi:hypothetical protein
VELYLFSLCGQGELCFLWHVMTAETKKGRRVFRICKIAKVFEI